MIFRKFLACAAALAAVPLSGFVGCAATNKVEVACTAGTTQPCDCEPGVSGVQACRNDGSGFDECNCGGGTGGSGGGGLSCESYCNDVMANCQGTNIQWSNLDTCLGACESYDVGQASDESGNTLGCRSTFARGAANDPDSNCVRAGPSGGGVCGSECDGYCTLMQNVCPGSFTDSGSCSEACLMFDVVGPFNATIVTGDSRECRTYHVSVAAENPPETAAIHCPHSGVVPTANCVP